LGSTIADSGYAGLVLDRLAKQAMQVLDMDRSSIFVHDEGRPGMAILAAAHGPDRGLIGKRVALGSEHSPARGGASVDLCWDGSVHGVLCVSSTTRPRRLSASDLFVLRSIADAASAAVCHAYTRAAIAPDARNQIARLVATLDERDGYTARHSQEVVETASQIGNALDLEPAELAELEIAALLHDIGKAHVPSAILKKPGKLTADEYAVMVKHPSWGAEMLAKVPGLEVVANIVRFHHERWDGAGYPAGITGPRIPLASRIIAVCDSYNAMTSDRPYRAAMTREVAIEELRTGAGWQFDPGVVAQFEIALHNRSMQ
jgi:putative nucleotidyltransferase with HDIG domain